MIILIQKMHRGVAVCSGAGASAFVRSACPSAVVFSPSFDGPGSLPARASACVRSCAASGPGAAWVVFMTGPCSAGVVPAPSWHAGRRVLVCAWCSRAAGVGRCVGSRWRWRVGFWLAVRARCRFPVLAFLFSFRRRLWHVFQKVTRCAV